MREHRGGGMDLTFTGYLCMQALREAFNMQQYT